jgi:hypothetical protein
MKNRAIYIAIPSLVSLLFSYTIYIYLLQAPTILSWSRLILAFLLWISLFLFIYSRVERVPIVTLFAKGSLAGTVGLFILTNLVFAASLTNLPYTYFFLPSQTVRIIPVSQDKKINLVSYNTEFTKWVSIDNFKTHFGWSTEGMGINHQTGNVNALIWQGKPGQYVEIQFRTCPDCDKVNIGWNSLESQEVDLSIHSPDNRISVRHDFPPLIWHKLGNFIALELSVLLASFIISMLGSYKFIDNHAGGEQVIGITSHFGKAFPYVSLAVLTVLTYGLKIQPILFNDDWCQVYMLNFHTVRPFMENERRPLHWFLQWLLHQVFSLETTVYAVYLTTVVFLFLTSVLIFVLVRRFDEHKVWFALLFAGLFLVYPSDYTRLYFTILGIRFAFLLLIVMMILFFDFMMRGNWIKGILIIPLLVLSLLMYEGQLGLAAAWGFIMFGLFKRDLSLKKVFLISGYYLVIGIFVYWKLVLQPKIYTDGKFESLSLAPKEIINRYFSALHTLLGGFKFPYQDTSWLSPGNIAIIISILICLVGAYFVVSRVYKQQLSQSRLSKSLEADYFWLLVGVITWVAGNFPIILNYPPNIYGHMSRVNIFSLPGAVLILLSVIHIVILSLTRNGHIAAKLTIIASLVLISLGSVIQLQSQEAYNRSWKEVKDFYRVLFADIPDIQNNIQIALIINGYQDDGRLYRPLFSSQWEAYCAFTTLYDKPGLIVGYRYERINVPHFPGFNIFTSTLETDTISRSQDAAKLLIIHYDTQAKSLTIQEKLAGFQGLVTGGGYSPRDLILPLDRPILAREIVK